jgi:uncharacterized protein YndB with AHSA1/START domain
MNSTSNTNSTNTTGRHNSATVSLPSDCEIVITRQFDAPASLVFKAYTTPELVKRWWGFDSSQWLVCEIDLREGGGWRYVTREEGGFEVGFHGEYRNIKAPHLLVSTEVYEGLPEAVEGSLNTIQFEEQNGVTTMTMQVLHTCKEHRDFHIASGMEGGMQVSMNRLEAIALELDQK